MDTAHFTRQKTVRVPSASVKAIVATDYELVEAPGAGKAIVLLYALLTLDYNSVAYTWANTDHSLSIGPATTDSDAEAQALIESGDAFTMRLAPSVDSAEVVGNTALNLSAAGTGEPVTGDSDLVVHVVYQIIDISGNDV